MNTQGETTMTRLEVFINDSRNYNSDLRSAVVRLDTICTKLGHGNYPKNQPQKEVVPTPVKTSDGLMDDLGELIRQKESLNSELRVAIDYLEAHI